jgi:hypothetical protein
MRTTRHNEELVIIWDLVIDLQELDHRMEALKPANVPLNKLIVFSLAKIENATPINK